MWLPRASSAPSTARRLVLPRTSAMASLTVFKVSSISSTFSENPYLIDQHRSLMRTFGMFMTTLRNCSGLSHFTSGPSSAVICSISSGVATFARIFSRCSRESKVSSRLAIAAFTSFTGGKEDIMIATAFERFGSSAFARTDLGLAELESACSVLVDICANCASKAGLSKVGSFTSSHTVAGLPSLDSGVSSRIRFQCKIFIFASGWTTGFVGSFFAVPMAGGAPGTAGAPRPGGAPDIGGGGGAPAARGGGGAIGGGGGPTTEGGGGMDPP
mmetsp:Transcript_9893/g.24498  ORF Transcript_9893/g.24498 Transcript_9893/m.24498 type:complete len:272 (-) Transcript_9893:1316-2131(-)